jgi:hypothetical protein
MTPAAVSDPIGDGRTDNSPLFEAAFARLTAAGIGGLHLAAGTYLVSRTVELPTSVSLQLGPGVRLTATPGFRGEAMVRKQRGVIGVHTWNGHISGGLIDGGRQDVVGIHVPGACRLDIHDIEIVDCLRKGIHVGNSTETWGYEVNIRGVRCAIDMQTAHMPGSIGVHYERITDSYISQVVIIGYETGVASESAANDFSQVHVWNVPAHGPLKRNFHCNGWGDNWNQCYADAPFDEGREMWWIQDEAQFGRTLIDTYELTRALDPTRPVHPASGGVHCRTDLWSVHSYEQKGPDLARVMGEKQDANLARAQKLLGEARAHAGQPLLLDEFGGIKWQTAPSGAADWGYGDAPKSLEEFYTRLAELVDATLAQPGYVGYCYTQLTDVEQEMNGIYQYDRTPKFDPARIHAAFSRDPGMDR